MAKLEIFVTTKGRNVAINPDMVQCIVRDPEKETTIVLSDGLTYAISQDFLEVLKILNHKNTDF